jgi:hypothetical protein
VIWSSSGHPDGSGHIIALPSPRSYRVDQRIQSAYGVRDLADLDPTRVRGAPAPETPPLVAETLLRRTAQPVLARRRHPTGAWPITLKWILDIIDDHPGWPSAAALRTIFRYHRAKANRILTDSSSRQHNSGSEEVADRDPDTIKRDIDQARDQLASTLDSPAKLAKLAQGCRRREGGGRAVSSTSRRWAVSPAGVGALVVVVVVRRIRRR